MTECIFVLKGVSLSFSIKTDVPISSIDVSTARGTSTQHDRFEVRESGCRYVGNIRLTQMINPDTVSFMVNFPAGASDSCTARGFVAGKVHDCIDLDLNAA
jgi:hypothetical protein